MVYLIIYTIFMAYVYLFLAVAAYAAIALGFEFMVNCFTTINDFIKKS
jgi:hypothetical protein